MPDQCDKAGLSRWCNNQDVRQVQLRCQAAGVFGTNEFKGPVVYMCSECRKSNRGSFKFYTQLEPQGAK